MRNTERDSAEETEINTTMTKQRQIKTKSMKKKIANKRYRQKR